MPTFRKNENSARVVRWAGVAGLALAAHKVVLRLREQSLAGQVAVIMGGSRGLGLLLAQEFARAGCRVAITARQPDELTNAVEILRKQGIEVAAFPCDVAQREQVDSVLEQIARRMGPIDIVVNNAAIMVVGPVTSMTLQDFEDAMAVMYWGTVYATQAVLPHMRARGYGRIVNITSIGGKLSVPHMQPYSAAKFAAVAFSEGLRSELLHDGVIVTTVIPGLMRTGGTTHAAYKGDQEAEFTWLNLTDSLPIVSMSGEKAAREIVVATRRGDAELILSLPAKILVRFHGLFPGFTTDLVGLAARLILPANDQPYAEPGTTVRRRIHVPFLHTLISMNMRAAERLNQYGTPPIRESQSASHRDVDKR